MLFWFLYLCWRVHWRLLSCALIGQVYGACVLCACGVRAEVDKAVDHVHLAEGKCSGEVKLGGSGALVASIVH